MKTVQTLLATHLVPYPPDSGGKLVSSHTLSALAGMGPVDVCAFEAPWGRPAGLAQLRQVARTVVTVPLWRRPLGYWPLLAARGLPYYVLRDYSDQMQTRLRRRGQAEYDVLFADSLHMAPYISPMPGPKVLQQHNVESYLVGEFLGHHRNAIVRAAGRVERRHLEAFERDQCNAFDAVVTLSEVDRARLEALGIRTPITVIPPAVEPAEPVLDGPERTGVVHIGTGHWPPIADGLRWYLESVHPRVRQAVPSVEILLAGTPSRDLAVRNGRDGVRVLGYMEDLRPVYERAAVFIVPLLVGGGTRLKILHALARGIAVVSTSPGCEGLATQHGRHLLVADAPEAFADAIAAVLRDPRLRRELGAQGRAYVLEQFRPETRCAQLAALIRAVASGRAVADYGLQR